MKLKSKETATENVWIFFYLSVRPRKYQKTWKNQSVNRHRSFKEQVPKSAKTASNVQGHCFDWLQEIFIRMLWDTQRFEDSTWQDCKINQKRKKETNITTLETRMLAWGIFLVGWVCLLLWHLSVVTLNP